MTTNRININEGHTMPTIEPAGPLFGPDALSLSITEDAARTAVRIYPDAANAQLRDAGLATRYYLQPMSARVADRQGGVGLDFSLTAVVRRIPASGAIEYVNATGTLTTALALPPSAFEVAFEQLTTPGGTEPAPRIRNLFDYASGDPEPQLASVPLLHSSASCTFLSPEGVNAAPRFSAQSTPGGSIGMQAHNTYLLSCGPDEAEAIATSLKSGSDFPLRADYVLTERFSTGDSDLNVTVVADIDKLYAELACTAAADGSLTNRDVSAAFARAVGAGTWLRLTATSGGVTHTDPELLTWLGHCLEVKNGVVELVGAELFGAGAGGPGDGVVLRGGHQNRGIQLTTSLVLSGPISAERIVPTDFSALTEAAKTNVKTYLSEIGAG